MLGSIAVGDQLVSSCSTDCIDSFVPSSGGSELARTAVALTVREALGGQTPSFQSIRSHRRPPSFGCGTKIGCDQSGQWYWTGLGSGGLVSLSDLFFDPGLNHMVGPGGGSLRQSDWMWKLAGSDQPI